ncbi:uncharacterized protein N7458_005023 [Penicillium daleae]|uniref:Uncharacterized protein n=1 Tax=Penicillium daleae TaxID=63821 RepID=A0AAD6C784_9EURO|nr:uncharacterized protein N7458_005023 [Penicillium daleae]KAJ5454067.1 hypothetical protein N7458_005023 [Penicillium daleae]
MVSVPISSPRVLALTSVSTSYRGLASEKASQTLQANFAQLSYIRPSSRLVSDEVTPIKAHTSCSKSLPPKLQLIQAKIFANTRESEGMPANNPLGNGSNITPPTASVESLASTTESNDTLNQPSPETSHSDPSLLGATPSTDSPTQSLITVNMYSSSTSNLESLGSLHNSLTVLTTSSKQVDLGIERFASVTTGSNKSPSDDSNDDLGQTEITQASLIRTSDEGRVQLGHFSHTQMESQNASQGETTQGSYGPQLSPTRVDISPHPSSTTTTTDIVFSNPTNSSTVDGSGVSRQPSKQSLSAIFGSYVIKISETRVSKGIPYIAHVKATKKANVQN